MSPWYTSTLEAVARQYGFSAKVPVKQLKESDLRRFTVQGTAVAQADLLLDRKYGRLRSPVLGPDGALYITTSNGSGDRIIRLTAIQPP